jgi:hypothetical protein
MHQRYERRCFGSRGKTVEETMTFMKSIAAASILVASLGFAACASADDAKMADCVQKAKEVTMAIQAAQPGQSTDQARDIARNARALCTNTYYDRGVAQYSKALTLLGKS